MHQQAQTLRPAPDPAPAPVRDTPPCLAFLLKIVSTLLGYGRQLDAILPAKAAHPRYPTLAAGFGTHDVRRILAHVHRGILRAMMLRKYLLARAAQGRDVEPVHPPAPADPSEIEALELKLRAPVQRTRRAVRDPHDPLHFAIPTLRELESQVRRHSVGHTIAEICLDLGVTPTFCSGETWDEILQALMRFGADLAHFFGVQQRRRETFQRERDKRPETWAIDWRDRPREAIRQLLDAPA